MKFIHFILFVVLSSVTAYAQNALFEISSGNSQDNIYINSLDSITFEQHDNSISQVFWKNGGSFSQPISEGDFVKSTNKEMAYFTFNNLENGITSGILFEDGTYGLAMTSEINPRKVLILGDSPEFDNILIAELDEFDMIRKIVIGDDFFTINYLKDKAIVKYFNSDQNLIEGIDVPYNKLYSTGETDKVIARSSALTDNTWFKAGQALDAFLGLKNLSGSNYLSALLQLQNNKNSQDAGRLIGFLGSIASLNPLGISIGLIDMHDLIEERLLYGGASIETGDSEVTNCNNVNLTAVINKFSQINLTGYELDCVMTIWDSYGNQYAQSKKNISSSTDLNFDFRNLNFNTTYSYQSSLNLFYYDIIYNPNISLSNLFLSTPQTGNFKPTRIKCSQYLKGSIKYFMTSSPSSVIDKISDITEKSVNVHCSFSDVPEGATCGVYIWKENSSKIPYTGSSTNGQTVISVSGLEAATLYYCQAYVNANGVLFLSDKIESFETDLPDVSGTWTCTQQNYDKFTDSYSEESYTITLNANGSVSSSKYSDILSGSWSYGKDGKLTISIMDFATQSFNHGINWSFTADNIKNPHTFTGGVYGWNWNSVVGYVQGDGSSCTLSR